GLGGGADDGAAGFVLQRQIAAGVVAVMVGRQDVGEPPALARQCRGDRPGIGRIDRGHAAGVGIADQHAKVVGEAGKLVDLKLGHEDNSGAFACFFGSLQHPNSARFEFNRLAWVARLAAERAKAADDPWNGCGRARMQLDVVDLRDFYNRPLGGFVRRLLTGRIRARWRNLEGCQLMGLGFAAPYIGMFRGEAARLGALMPATQGALVWPASGPAQAGMVQEARLPPSDGLSARLPPRACPQACRAPG